MSIKILTKNAVENTNIDGARDCNFNAGRRSGIVKGALNQGNFFSSSSNTIALDTCELRLCGHRIVLDAVEYKTLSNIPSVPIRYSMVAQVVVDDNNDVSFDLIIQSSSTPLVQENLDTTGKGKFQLEIGKFTQQTDGTITDIVRTADLITGGIGDSDGGKINIGNVTTNTLEPGMEAEVDVENRYDAEKKKTFTDFTFSIPKGDKGIQGIQGKTGETGNGIISISKTGTSKLVDTYTISFTSGETTTFQVTNGKGITKIEKTATSGLVDTYTITFNDTTTDTFQVTNGAKGDKGDKGDVGATPNITATATTLPAGSSATVTKSGTAENPAFAFGIPKGDNGDKGDKGEKGDKGDVGVTPNITAEAETLSAGSQATVTKSGTAENPNFKFGIPKGEKGDKGDKGDQGDSGKLYSSLGQNTDGAMTQKATTDELAKKIDKTGGTFTGEVKFNEVDGECINYTNGFYINKKNGSTLIGTNGTKVWVGTPDTALTMRGNATRPTYNGNDLGLKSDMDSSLYTLNISVSDTSKNQSGTIASDLYAKLLASKRPVVKVSDSSISISLSLWTRIDDSDPINTSFSAKSSGTEYYITFSEYSGNNISWTYNVETVPQVAQSLGTSSTDVISQKVVTDELNKKVEVQVFNSEEAAKTASQANPNLICLY